jgi:hypothetical protein
MTARTDFHVALDEHRWEDAKAILDANPELGYLREMFYRVWSFTEHLTPEQMGLG